MKELIWKYTKKSNFVIFKNKVLQSLQGDIRKLFDSEINISKSRCKGLVAKSNTKFDNQIKHLPEKLKPKDEIKNHTLTLLDNIIYSELQSKTNIVIHEEPINQ